MKRLTHFLLLFTSLVLGSCNAPENEALGADPFKEPSHRPLTCDGSRLRLTKLESGVAFSRALEEQSELNQEVCRKLQKAFESKKTSVAELWPSQNLPKIALDLSPTRWNKSLALPAEDAEFVVTDVHAIEYTENYEGCANQESVAPSKHTCLVPSAIKINSTKVSIRFPKNAKRVEDLKEIANSTSGAIIRGGVRWNYGSLIPGVRTFDGLMLHWFVAPEASALESEARERFGDDVKLSAENTYARVPLNGCQIRAVQFSADGFKDSRTVWLTRASQNPLLTLDEVCASTGSIFQNKDITTAEVDPWSLYDLAPVEPLLTGSHILPFDGASGAHLACDPNFDCPLMMETSVRKVLSQAFSPSKSQDSLWVRFFWIPIGTAKPVMTTVRVSIESGDIQETTSRIWPNSAGLPQVN